MIIMKYRITESRLRGMIQEAVKGVLKEVYNFASSEPQFDINSPEYATVYDQDRGTDMFDYWQPEDDERVADYEKLPDSARHPYGAECPDFSDRIANRPWKVKASDKLASKEPNSLVNQKKGVHKLDYPDCLPDSFFRDDAVHQDRWKYV